MSYDTTKKQLEDIIEKHDGNEYAATVEIYNKAQQLLDKVDNSISSNEAIDWAITGYPPDNLERKIEVHHNAKKHRTRYLEKLLSDIDDKEIENAVRESFDQSAKIGSLTFYYNRMADRYKKKRVRILTRMCWYNAYGGR